MKSEKARKYIEDWTFEAADLVDADGVGAIVLRRYEAVKAVELAEQEAEERMRAELTRWRDPKKELPEEGEWVMLKMRDDSLFSYMFALYSEGQWNKLGGIVPTDDFIGWRPIEE